MYNVTQEFLNAIKQNGRQFRANVVIRDVIFEDNKIIDMSLEENVNSNDSFMLGSVASNKFEISLVDVPSTLILENATVTPKLGLLVGTTYEEVPLGVFTVDEISKDKNTVKLTCFDNMIKLEKAYFSDLSYPASINSIVQEICLKAGVQLATTLPNTLVNEIEGYTYREAISFIASFFGGFARFNRAGKLEIISYGATNIEVTGDNYFKLKTGEKAFSIGRLACKVGENILSAGTNGNEIQFENPIMTQTQLTNIYSKLKTLSYMPYNMDWQGNMALTAGDKLTITDVKGNTYNTLLMQQKLTYKGGLKSTATAVAKTEQAQEFSSSGSMKNKVERMVVEQTNIKIALIQKATIEDLTVTNMKVNTIVGDVGAIQDLLTGNLTAVNMQTNFITAESELIANGAIRDAMIESLSVNKILAGNISTNKFVVGSDSGNLKIQDNTLKVWDKAGKERVSLGLNGSDYNLLVRGADGNTVLFGTDGVTKAGITTGAVDDSKIATNANINGSKIEKESLVTQINGATTLLKATKVKLDSENQTLEVAFTSLKGAVTSQGSTITSQGTSISTIQGQISSKVWQQDINTAIDPVSGKVTTLENNYSGLNQTLNSISLNVSSLQTTTSNLGTRITAAEGSISVLQGQIALKVTQADIDNSINAIQVGGRNLFKGYGDKEIRLTDYQSTGSFSQFVNSFSFDPSEYVGSIFTISFWAKSPNGTTPIQVYNNNGSPRYFYFLTTLDMSLGTEWKYYTYTFTNTDRGSSYTPSNKIEIYAQSKTGVVVKKIKLELGNKATDWTPAPEDIDGAVSALTSRISTAELKITPTEIVNSINTTDGVGKVKSVNVTIDSTGLTVANGKIIIKNNAGQSVLSADTSGNLSIQGELKGYYNGNLATHILRESIRFYNWDVPGQELGYIAGTFNPQNTAVKGVTLASSNGKYVSINSGSGSVFVNNGYNPNGYTEPIVLSGNINFSNYNLVRVGDINYGSTSATRIYNLTLYDNEVDTNKSSLALWLNYSGPAGGCSTYIGDGRGNFGYLKAGSLTITGSKNCVQKTKNYGNLLINAYETAEYYFGDIGTGRLENGECIVWIDEIFKDCINTDIQYQVFLSKYGIGDIWVAERQKDYFIVKGVEDIDFAWELKAKRKGYENDRLERESNEAEKENKPDHEQRYALTTIEEEAKKTMVTIDTLNAFAFEETQWLDESTSCVVDDLLDLNQYYKDLEV